MKLLIDLDRTVLDTERVIKQAQALLKKRGVDMGLWEKVWPGHRKEGFMRAGQYSVWKHISRYKKYRHHDFSDFLREYEKLYLPNSGNWFADSLKFVKKYKKSETVVLITRGDDRFQTLKIDKGKIRKHFDQVKIVPAHKGPFFNQVLSKSEVNVFIDDNPYEVDSVKSHHPEAIAIKLLAGEEIFRGKWSELADFEAKNFAEIDKIVSRISQSFIDQKQALTELKRGKSVVYPTDTAYGLGVDATNLKAVSRLYKIKGRTKQATHIAVSDLTMAKKYVEFSKIAEKIFKKLLPGPLTLILPLKKSAPPSIKKLSGGTDTLGIRMPDCGTALNLVKRLKRPLTTPSANPKGGEAPYAAAAAFNQFYGRKYQPDFYLDAGLLAKTKPSTLLTLSNGQLAVLRAGPITKKEILKKI